MLAACSICFSLTFELRYQFQGVQIVIIEADISDFLRRQSKLIAPFGSGGQFIKVIKTILKAQILYNIEGFTVSRIKLNQIIVHVNV